MSDKQKVNYERAELTFDFELSLRRQYGPGKNGAFATREAHTIFSLLDIREDWLAEKVGLLRQIEDLKTQLAEATAPPKGEAPKTDAQQQQQGRRQQPPQGPRNQQGAKTQVPAVDEKPPVDSGDQQPVQ